MKSNKHIRLMLMPLVIGMTATLLSCQGFLEETSESQHTMDNFYRNKAELEEGLRGVYAQAKTLYQGGSLCITLVGTDEVYVSSVTNNTSVADRYLYPASHTTTTDWYKTHYKVIQSANIIVSRGPGVEQISEADRRQLMAEAKVIRAWAYFRLVQTFGRIPLVLTETQDFNFRLRRNPIEEVYKAIIKDLTDACADEVLPAAKVTGRINQWVAKGLLAKVYLTLGTSMTRRPQPIDEYRDLPFDPLQLFSDSRDLCDQIIASKVYSLASLYHDNFLLTRKNGVESMWELQFGSTPKMGAEWSKFMGVSQNNYPNAYTASCMVGRGTYCPLPSFYRMFRLGDARRTWSLADYRVDFDKNTTAPLGFLYIKDETISNTTSEKCNLDTDDPDSLARSLSSTAASHMRISKYRWGYGEDPSKYWTEKLSFESSNAPNNVVVLRYADVLLMRVEADMLCNQGVAGTTSLDIMNKQLLPRARGVNPETKTFYTEAEMLAATMAPYQARITAAQTAYDNDPSAANQEALDYATMDYDRKLARCLVSYTAATLTYDELLAQRACELCFEFQRWFDLCRTGKLHTLVPARIVNPNTIPAVSFNFDVNYLMPIPTYELDLATDKTLFYQNYGY